MEIWQWALNIDWAEVVVTFAIPVAAILIPTIIAIRLARRERRDAAAASERQRILEAGANIIVALAPLASFTDVEEPMRERLWELRARIAVYRAWITPDDLSGDWLALRHREGMSRWALAMTAINSAGGPSAISTDLLLQFLEPAHEWSSGTIELLSAWMRGDVPDTTLRKDGERIIKEFGAPPAPRI